MMSERRFEFDVIVVGAGIGGSAAAMVAAQKGLKVAMVERARVPGEKNYFG
jgi:electron transfer flavoprotein-quinone oxidoreductase